MTYLKHKNGSLEEKVLEAMDPVNKKALKKDFDDRKDKDIDNDGDVDASDKYLVKRRKGVCIFGIKKSRFKIFFFSNHL